MNKKSVREEVDRVKEEFELLRKKGELTPEVQSLINSLLLVVELIIFIFMEKKTRKTSKNSSLPSLQTAKDETATESRGKSGKGKKVAGAVNNSRTLETISVASVTTCEVCGAPLEDRPCQCHERRTRIDIVFENVVEPVDAEVKQCPRQ